MFLKRTQNKVHLVWTTCEKGLKKDDDEKKLKKSLVFILFKDVFSSFRIEAENKFFSYCTNLFLHFQ